jgi:hypothetical protein
MPLARNLPVGETLERLGTVDSTMHPILDSNGTGRWADALDEQSKSSYPISEQCTLPLTFQPQIYGLY